MKQKLTVLGRNYRVFNLFKHLVESLNPKYAFLLESIESRNRPLYSFLCLEPDYILEVKGGKARVTEVASERGERLLEAIRSGPTPRSPISEKIQDMVENRIEALDELARWLPNVNSRRPAFAARQVFYGGYLGVLSYDIVAPWVGFRSASPTPDILLGMHTSVLVYEHATQTLYHVDNQVGGRKAELAPLTRALERYRSRVYKYEERKASEGEFKSNMREEEFREKVERAKRYIFDGDIFQVVLSRSVRRSLSRGDMEGSLDIYGALRALNPSPYMYYLSFGKIRLVGSSPEALVSVNGRKITTVPIAGTRRRGESVREESRMFRELTTDAKELAEHIMLVDLARNDVAKLSEPGSVDVQGLMKVRRYRHVMHLVTTVTGTARMGLKPTDILKGMFPAGTVTGAPKLRAMEIIHELERESRGLYAGGVGYIAFNGDEDWAITIRTIQLLNREATVQAGAGIVADSVPRLEWIETENKMRSLLKAINISEVA